MTLLGLNPLFATRLPDLIAAMTTNPKAGGIVLALASAAAETAVFGRRAMRLGWRLVQALVAVLLKMLPWMCGLLAATAFAVRNILSTPTHPRSCCC